MAWSFETAAAKSMAATLVKPDGTPNGPAAYGSENFYDGMVIGAARMMNLGAIYASATIAGSVLYVGSTDGNFYALY